MQISTMRLVDRWLGVPGCWMLSVVRACGDLFTRPGPDRISKIAFLKLAEQGSTVLASGAFRQAIGKVGRENVFFVCFEENRFILDVMELIPPENVITIRSTSLMAAVSDAWSAVRSLRRGQVDSVVDIEFFARSTAMLSYLIGARRRAGFHRVRGEGPYRGTLTTHRMRFNPHLHTCQSFELLVKLLEAPDDCFPTFDTTVPSGDEPPPTFRPRPGELDETRVLLTDAAGGTFPTPLVLLNPNCSDIMPLRAWPAERYVELARRLLDQEPQLWIGFTGAPSEESEASALVDRVGSPRCFKLAGRTTLRDLLVIYGLAELLVTNDSGPAQFAAMTPLDVITLFGPEHPRLFAARSPRNVVIYSGLPCSPCISALNDRDTDCRDNRCMKEITVDAVERESLRILADRRDRKRERTVELEVLPAAALTGVGLSSSGAGGRTVAPPSVERPSGPA